MKRFIILTVIITAFSSGLFAQVPGYMGKKFYVNYDINLFPALSNETFGEQKHDPEVVYHGINLRHAFEADYVISRTNSIGLSYGFFRSRFFYLDSAVMPHVPSLNATALGLNYTVFIKQKGALAPFGTYAKITGELISYKMKTDLEPIPVITKGEKKLKAVSITIGEQKIYFDRLILDVGAQFGYVQGWLTYLPDDRNIQFNAANRIRYHYAMNVHARIGFLIF